MSGGWQTYRCDRCPLAVELGGSTWWDETGAVYSKTVQVACRACGTMHRVTEERGECRVTALPGPVRASRTATLRDISGEEHETEYWVTEGDWQPSGRSPAASRRPRNCRAATADGPPGWSRSPPSNCLIHVAMAG